MELLSNGPGDPEPLKDSIKVVELNYPNFFLNFSVSNSTFSGTFYREKHNGHRINHPIKNLITIVK